MCRNDFISYVNEESNKSTVLQGKLKTSEVHETRQNQTSDFINKRNEWKTTVILILSFWE